MKSPRPGGAGDGLESLPTRGAWIEIDSVKIAGEVDQGRSPHWERGLKFVQGPGRAAGGDVAPHTGSVD